MHTDCSAEVRRGARLGRKRSLINLVSRNYTANLSEPLLGFFELLFLYLLILGGPCGAIINLCCLLDVRAPSGSEPSRRAADAAAVTSFSLFSPFNNPDAEPQHAERAKRGEKPKISRIRDQPLRTEVVRCSVEADSSSLSSQSSNLSAPVRSRGVSPGASGGGGADERAADVCAAGGFGARGPRGDGRRAPPLLVGEGPRGDGPRGDGPRGERRRGDGPRDDGPAGEGPRGDGARDDGPREAEPWLGSRLGGRGAGAFSRLRARADVGTTLFGSGDADAEAERPPRPRSRRSPAGATVADGAF